ncbi:hypothetical protein D918_05391 [Trichuris suis]|nr:hypothetical protein D918_05391 [Trichuris suis]
MHFECNVFRKDLYAFWSTYFMQLPEVNSQEDRTFSRGTSIYCFVKKRINGSGQVLPRSNTSFTAKTKVHSQSVQTN